MKWVLIANPYPYETATDYFSLGIIILILVLSIVGIWKIIKSLENGEGAQ